MKISELKENLKEILVNKVSLVEVVIDINNYLEDEFYYLDFNLMKYFNNFMCDCDPLFIAKKVQYGKFNVNDKYFRIEEGNLISYTENQAKNICLYHIDEIINTLIYNYDYIITFKEIHELFNEYLPY